jgi:hypothetical protein
LSVTANAAALESRNGLGELNSTQIAQALVNLGLSATSPSPSNISAGYFSLPTTTNYVMTSGGPAFMFLHGSLSGTPSAVASGAKIQIHDTMLHPGGQDYGVYIQNDIAPSGTSASGSRIGLEVDQTEWGTFNSGGSYTNLLDASALRANERMDSNRGGTSTNYAGQGFGVNATCIAGPATFVDGCVGQEIDVSSAAAFSYLTNVGLQIVINGGVGSEGLLNDNTGLLFGNSISSAVGLFKYGIRINQPNGAYPLDPYAAVFSVAPQGAGNGPAITAGAGIDLAQETYHGFATSAPFQKTVPLQATAITGATRLTSDGLAANGYIQDAFSKAVGTGYTSNPTVAVTGCSGTNGVVNTQISGSVVARYGVYTPGSGCSSDVTLTLSGGGGTLATATPEVEGNTLNFPHLTVVDVKCTVVARGNGLGIGWSIEFGAHQNGSASTATISGTPAWTQVFADGTAASDISIAAPTADTTLGAINITVTPTTFSWTVGGSCTMTGTTQVL